MADSVAVERRIVTVLFADLVGFTPLSERLDAEDVASIQDAYFATVRETVGRYGGVLEKFIGDAAMAVFGAPRARDDDAERAVRAGLALIAAIEQLGARLGLEPGVLRLRVGVNSGEVVHATAGPDSGRVTGDTVNTAARLQAAAHPDSVLLGELTALAVGEAIELSDAAPVELKGKADPVLARTAVAVRPVGSRDDALAGLRAPLLGRERELRELESALDAGRGRLAIVAPPGVGKSRLVAELATRAEERGVRVVRSRVRPTAAAPFEAVAELLVGSGAGDPARLADALATSGVAPARREVVAAEVSALTGRAGAAAATLTGEPDVPATDLAGERERRFAAWREALDSMSAGRPALWIVEDVHWAAGDLLAFLDHAAGEQPPGGRLVVATARPSLVDTATTWMSEGTVLELSTLPALDAQGLVRALVGDALPTPLVEAVAERSDGNPLFIEELLRTWVSVGTLVPTDAGWRLAVDPGDVALPGTVQAIYAAQLDDLPAEARRVARRASVAGRRFPEAALEPLDLDASREGLEVLRRRAFVAGPQADPLTGDVYAYRHALLRDAGYASLARIERARLHHALGRWFEATAGSRGDQVAELVAGHYAAALESLPALAATDGGGLDRVRLAASAAAAYERAAGASLAVSAHEHAARLLARAIELTDPEATLDLARRRLRHGEVLADSADLAIGIDEMRAALEGLTGLLPGAASLYAEAAYRLALAYMQQIRFPEAEALAAEARDRLGAGEDAGRARLMALHAWTVAAQGRDDGALAEAASAREIAARLDDIALSIDVLEHYAAARDELDEEGVGPWVELEELARRAGRWRQVAIASRIRGVLAAQEDPRHALRLLDASAETARAHGLTEQEGWADLARCETRWVLGDWDEALVVADRAIALGERYAYERLAFRTWVVALPLLAARRDPSWLPRYERWWAVAAAHFPPSPSPYGTVLRAALDVWIDTARGVPPDGIAPPPPDLADILPAFSNPHVLAAIESIARVWLATGARAPIPSLARWARTTLSLPDATALMRASAALVTAWTAAATGEEGEAEAMGAAALEHARAASAPWWEARAMRTLGLDASAIERPLGTSG